MAHSHAHSHDDLDHGPPRRGLATVLAVVVGLLTVVTVAAMIALWPHDVPKSANPYGQKGVSTIDATVTQVKPFDCQSGQPGPDGMVTVKGDCANVTASTADGLATFQLDSARYKAGIERGDDIRLIRIAPDGQQPTYEFLDFQRGFPLTAIALVFGVLVVAVARWRGLFAILGIGLTLLALTRFVLPALLSGESPVLVAVVGSTAIMIALLYLAHGVSIRTTSALFGTLFGIACTALVGVAATGWTSLNGIGSEDDQTLIATVSTISMHEIVAATMVIAGLGVLNDVTVTQASAVWELRALQPTASRTHLFRSAMRIGRDHIASSVYTLVFAYAGSAMTVLLLITAYQRGLVEMATTEEIAQEIVRTLVGAIGLVLAVPVTTAFAVWLAPGTQDDGDPGLATAEPDRPVDADPSWTPRRSAGRRRLEE
ncbi:MAG: YibE/F family protein [Aeromicrobium erythreum]